MSKLPDIGSDTNQDEKDYAEYIGVGDAHTKPPAKKMRLMTSSVSSFDEPTEPKSIDVFASSQPTSESKNSSQDDYETCRESFCDEDETKTPQKLKNSAENDQKMSEIEPKSAKNDPKSPKIGSKSPENPPEPESENVPDSEGAESDVSLEIDEKFDETEIYEQKKSEKTQEFEPKEAKIVENSSDEDEEVMKEMEQTRREELEKEKEHDEPIETQQSQDIFDYDSDNNEVPKYPIFPTSSESETAKKQENEESEEADEAMEVVEDPDEDVDVVGIDEEEIQKTQEDADIQMEIQETSDLVEMPQKLEADDEPVEQESETKSETSCRKKIERVSLDPNSDVDIEEVSSEDVGSSDAVAAASPKNEEVEDPSASPQPPPRPIQIDKKLIFKPDFQSKYCDPLRNYRYCDVKTMPEQKRLYRSGGVEQRVLVNQGPFQQQRWNDLPNPNYMANRLLLERYLRENRLKTDGLMLFSGLIHDMCKMPNYHTFPALNRYFFRYGNYQGNPRYALDQFGRVVQIALTGYQILPQRIYLLIDDVESATLSHRQCAAILARMFFSRNYPNFIGILNSKSPVAVEKLRFLFAYFDRIATNPPDGCVSFRRIQLKPENIRDEWNRTRIQKIPEVVVLDDEVIEESTQCTQVDFANACLGGGVLKEGSVQEEIRFLMCPEMIVGMHLCIEKMDNLEAISIIGAHVYSSYQGYANTLKWKPLEPKHADQNEDSLRDKYGRLPVETIAIDASKFNSFYTYKASMAEQLNTSSISRETQKAATGFMSQIGNPAFDNVPIRTGWWGCGAFGGNKQLKFLIQVIAAGFARRPLHFCTFGDKELSDQCRHVLQRLRDKEVTVGTLFISLKYIRHQPVFTPGVVFDALLTRINDPEWQNSDPHFVRRDARPAQ